MKFLMLRDDNKKPLKVTLKALRKGIATVVAYNAVYIVSYKRLKQIK